MGGWETWGDICIDLEFDGVRWGATGEFRVVKLYMI